MLEDLMYLASLEDNVYMQRKLEKIKDLLTTQPNDALLGGKLRELLQ